MSVLKVTRAQNKMKWSGHDIDDLVSIKVSDADDDKYAVSLDMKWSGDGDIGYAKPTNGSINNIWCRRFLERRRFGLYHGL